jgi:hypothetical protein
VVSSVVPQVRELQRVLASRLERTQPATHRDNGNETEFADRMAVIQGLSDHGCELIATCDGMISMHVSGDAQEP